MSRNLIKIEAEDTSPLDVPGRPLPDFRPNPNQSWDRQVVPKQDDDPSPDAPDAGFRRIGMPHSPSPPRRTPRLEDLLPPPLDTKSSSTAPVAAEKPVPPNIAASMPALKLKPDPEPTSEPVSEKPQTDKPERLPPRLRKQQEKQSAKQSEPPAQGAADALVARQAESAAEKPAPAAPAEPLASGRPVPPSPRPPRTYQRQYTDNAQPTTVASMPAMPVAPGEGGDGGGGSPPDTPDIPSTVPERPPLPSDEDIRRGAMSGLKEPTDLSNCVLPLLKGLNWRGDPRQVAEALPHFINNIDITAFRNIMATLHYESRPVTLRLEQIDPRLMPCLFLPEDGSALILLGRKQNTLQIYDGGQDDYDEIAAAKFIFSLRWKPKI
jgi:hypothetical protein